MSFESPKPTIERPPGLKEEYATKNGGMIYVTPIGIEHLRAHPTVIPYLEEAMAQIELPTDGSKLITAVDLKRPLEKASCLKMPDIGLDEEGLFAVRLNRLGASRVTQEEPQESVSTVVVMAWPPVAAPDKYILRTAYIGQLSAKEPWDKQDDQERERSLAFWRTHALVHDPETMGSPFKSTWRQVIAEAAVQAAERDAVKGT